MKTNVLTFSAAGVLTLALLSTAALTTQAADAPNYKLIKEITVGGDGRLYVGLYAADEDIRSTDAWDLTIGDFTDHITAEGKTGWEIGKLLGISERTVVFHVENAARKLGVFGRRQAVARAIALQLITL